MAKGSLRKYLKLRAFPTGVRLFILNFVLRTVPETMQALADLVRACIAHDQATRQLEFAWSKRKGDTSVSRGKATVIDVQLDRTLALMEALARAQILSVDDQSEVARAARRLLEEVFPLGIAPVTQQSFEEQLATLDGLVVKFEGELAETVQTLGLGRHVEQLRPLIEQFRKELELTAPQHVPWDTVRAAQVEGQELLAEVFAVILGTLHARDEETTARREALLAEFNRQEERALEAFRRNRRPLDVDPATGEEVEDDLPLPPEEEAA